MQLNVPFAVFLSFGFILAGGCLTVKNNNSANLTDTPNFTPFSNTSDPFVNISMNESVNYSTISRGSLRVSISGISYPANLSVLLDNEFVGMVQPAKPLYLMVPEGNHTVKVCVGPVCEQENITTKFGRYVNVDFSERLQRDVKFPNPTARPTAQILDYYKNDNVVSVYVEFINPESVDHTMSAALSVGYTYIDGRSYVKLGDSAQAMTVVFVKAGQREIKKVDIYLTNSDSLISFDSPVIQDLKIK
jgi:hypothetical protein